jgi:hypothetical protein
MVGTQTKAPETLAERFWSVARVMEREATGLAGDHPDPVVVVRHVLKVLDAFDHGDVGDGVTKNTLSFLAMLRQYELRGDLAYASPEQARGEQVDERSLVFSVGVLLFEKLTGRHPFGDPTNPRRVARIQKGEMGSGVNFFPHVPTTLRSTLMRAMGPFPEERWESLAALRAELELFLAEETTPPSRPVTILPRGQTPPQLAAPPAAPEPPARQARGTVPPVASLAPAKPTASVFDAFEDDGPTRISDRPRTARPERAASAPGATLRSAGVAAPAALAAPRSRRWLAPVAYAAIGAAVTAAGFLATGPRASAPAKIAAAPARPTVWQTAEKTTASAAPTVVQAIQRPADDDVAPPQPTAAAAAAPAPPVAAAAAAPPPPPAPAPRRDTPPALTAALDALLPGQVGGPVRTEAGYYIVRLIAREAVPGRERRRVRHILFATGYAAVKRRRLERALDERAERLARDVVARAERGEPLAAIARALSEDRGSRALGGEITPAALARFGDDLARAGRALEPGRVVALRGPLGWHAIVLEKRERLTFAEAREGLLAAERARPGDEQERRALREKIIRELKR